MGSQQAGSLPSTARSMSLNSRNLSQEQFTLPGNLSHGIQDLATAANPFEGQAWSYTLDPDAAPPGLLISEMMADNKKTLHDEDGDSSDWIEIYNAGVITANLNG